MTVWCFVGIIDSAQLYVEAFFFGTFAASTDWPHSKELNQFELQLTITSSIRQVTPIITGSNVQT